MNRRAFTSNWVINFQHQPEWRSQLAFALGDTVSDIAIRTLQEAARQQNVRELWLKSVPKSRTYWKKKQGFLPLSGEEMYRVVPPKAA